jgi:hypothetical protein
MCFGFVAERGEEGVVLTREVVSHCEGDKVGKCEAGVVVEHGADIALGSDKASEVGWARDMMDL